MYSPYSHILKQLYSDLYDITDFGILRPTANRHHANSSDGGDWGDLMGEEYDHNNLSSPGGRAAVPKSASSSSLSQPKLRRRSSFARVFSSLGMTSSSIVEDDNVANITSGPDESGGLLDDSSETNRLSLLPPRFRRGSSVGLDALHHQRRSSMESIGGMRDSKLNSHGNIGIRNNSRIPKWAIHTATLLHQHSLLHDNNQSNMMNMMSSSAQQQQQYIVTPTWRIKDRMKTVGVCLVLALNIGTDPPDLHKPTPCAKLQCWLDPTSISRAKAKERIGERLEQQYSKWQQRSKLKYRRALDPTVDMVKELCFRMRESAKQERVLLHYNGHGVPRPTANGEIWLFDKHHTNYIPLSVTDLRKWIGKPSIVVLDCSGAGVLMPFFTSTLHHGHDSATTIGASGVSSSMPYNRSLNMGDTTSDPSSVVDATWPAIRDTIVLCPTSQGEWLPLNPEFPADIFTSCLTTPIPIALRWFIHQTPLSTQGLNPDTIIDAIPGKLADRKTPLGELNWIFTAITDTIAWNVLPSALFQRLFRQDLLVASMFRNFLLADRILRSLNCSPMSNPELPSTCHHPLWDAWDLAVETCLTQLIDSGHLRKGSMSETVPSSNVEEGDVATRRNSDDTPQTFPSSEQQQRGASNAKSHPPTTPPEVNAPFFAEQLTAFELWLEWASVKTRSKLIIRCPPSAVGGTPLPFLQRNEDPEKASYEIDPPQELPIVLQVLLSQAHRVRALLLLKRFLDLGPSAVNLALSVGIFPYVLKLLQSPIDEYKHVLIGIWAKVLAFDHTCREDVVKDRALPHFIRHLRWAIDPSSSRATTSKYNLEDAAEQRTKAAFILSVICSGGYTLGQSECINEKLHTTIDSLLQLLVSPKDTSFVESVMTSEFRMWLIICLGNLSKDNAAAQSEMYKAGLHLRLLARLSDDSPDVRTASSYALGCLIGQAPVISALNKVPSLSSMLQLQPPVPQSLASPPQGAALMPMNVSLNNPSPSITGTSPLLSFNQVQPLIPQGGASLLPPGKQQQPMFGNVLSKTPVVVPSASPQPEIKTVYEDEEQMEMDLLVAVKLAKKTMDASPEVRFEAILSVNRFIGKYIDAFVSIAGKTPAGSQQGRNILSIGGAAAPSIEMPDGITRDIEKQMSAVWSSILKLHRYDPFPAVRELINSIVVSINKRVMLEKNKIRQHRTANRRRSDVGSIDETEPSEGFPSPALSRRRNATGLNLSTYTTPDSNNMKRAGSAGTSTFTIGTPPTTTGNTSPRKFNAQFADLNAPVVEEYILPESLFYSWKKVTFGEQDGERISDPLSDNGAMQRYREGRNSLTRQKGQLLKDTFSILAERSILRSPYAYNESDAAAGIRERESLVEQRKDALQLEQVSVLRSSGARSTSLLCFHPYEPALVACSSNNISVYNAETSERISSFSNLNSKNTRMTSALWVNESSTSLLLTGSNDGMIRIFDVSVMMCCIVCENPLSFRIFHL